MSISTALSNNRLGKGAFLLGLVFLAGCAGANQAATGPQEGYVEIQNPGFTMSPNAPETIWVPRSYVEKGVPRGRDLAGKGYDAVTQGAAQGAPAAAAASAPAVPSAAAVAAPAAEPAAPAPVRLKDPNGKPAALVPHFGLVVALEGNRIYFNLGREDGITPGQKLKVYRGGTVVKGLGLAPGEAVGTLEARGFVGSNGGYGVMKEGGAAQTNDLVGFE